MPPLPTPVPTPTPTKKRWWRRWWGILVLAVFAVITLFFLYVGYLVIRTVVAPLPQDQAQNTKRFTVSSEGGEASRVDKSRLVRDTSASLGSPNAPVQIVEFVDFECPYCLESYPIIRSLAAEYGERIHYVFRHYPVPQLHERAEDTALAVLCAAKQEKFWPYHDRLFQNQAQLSDDDLRVFAESVGLNLSLFDECRRSSETREDLKRDVADGTALGVRGTPTWFINGTKVEGAIPEDIFRKVIDELLKQAE